MQVLPAEQVYDERERRFQADADAEQRRSRRFSRARLTVFLAGGGALAAALTLGGPSRALLLEGAALAALVFVVLVVLHDRVEDRLEHLTALAGINREQRARVRREWGAIPRVEPPAVAAEHPFAVDLDLFGRASLLQLTGAVATPHGARTLGGWLLHPADAETIQRRQGAVAELAPSLEFRQHLLARALQAARGRVASHESGLARFLEWSEEPSWLVSRPWLVWLTQMLGAAGVLLAIASATGLVGQPLWLVPALLNLAIWFPLARKIERSFNRAFARDSAPGRESRMFDVIERQRFEAPCLTALRERIDGACHATQRLQRLMELADIRLTTLIHFPLNALTLWDFHVLAAAERWQGRFGRRVRDWFAAVGEIEALSAFAALRHDNPGWALPEFTAQPVLSATALGHPLLPDGARVANDVTVGPPGSFLFVTGSNMSGKSTLLRAIGVNAVLAQAGAPVCAASMRLPRVAVVTSIRVQDSLEEGVSYFMAALQRLKLILQEAGFHAAPASETSGETTVLYLLDEILQGTNTAERQIAVRMILSQLLNTPAIGAVTSHDLNLADEQPLSSAAVAVHFEEHFDGDAMTFDYKLKPGVASSRNALKLMRMIGIDGGTAEPCG